MKSVLEELFYGNVCPNTDCRSKEKEVKELMSNISYHHSQNFLFASSISLSTA